MHKAGRGVFANVDIKKGNLIEKCPVIEIPWHDASNLNGSFLVTYIYYFGRNKDKPVVALGFGSIYNHTYKPNAIYKAKLKEMAIDFISIKDIKKDEEITVNYSNSDSKNKKQLWFKTAN